MCNTKEKTTITAKDLTEALKDLLRRNVVGITQGERACEFDYVFPGGKTFHVSIEKIQ